MRGVVSPARRARREAPQRIAAEPPMGGLDLARVVTPAAHEAPAPATGRARRRIDNGIKRSMVGYLAGRGCARRLHPCTTSAGELWRAAPTRVPEQRPRRPGRRRLRRPGGARARRQGAGVRHLPRAPAAGQAVGLRRSSSSSGTAAPTTRSRTCARAIEITTQNHGFAVRAPDGAARRGDEPVRWETDVGAAALTHVNLNDGTVEGRAAASQAPPCSTTPSPGPGPHDSLYLFDRFLEARPLPQARRPAQDPHHRLGTDRHRAGLRVRLLRHAGLQGAPRRGLRGRARQLQPGDDHDRPGVRRRGPTSSRSTSPVTQIIEVERPDALLPRSAARPRSTWPWSCTRTGRSSAAGSS